MRVFAAHSFDLHSLVILLARGARILGACWFVCALISLVSFAPVASADEMDPGVKRTASIGFYVYNIRDLDLHSQRFGADMYMWMRYRGPESKTLENLEFVNGRIETMEEQERARLGGENYVCWRVTGTFLARIQLTNYPFDKQRLELILEHPRWEADQLSFVHDEVSYRRSPSPEERWGIKNGIFVSDFRVVGTERRTERYAYESDFGKVEGTMLGSTYSRLVLSIRLQRIFWPYFQKILLPFLVLLGMAYLVFWLPPQEIVTSSLLSMAALVSSVIFELSVSQTLPDAGYLIVSDRFFLTTLGMIVATLIHSVVTFNLARNGREEAAYRLEIAARVAFPIVYAAAIGFLLLSATQGE